MYFMVMLSAVGTFLIGGLPNPEVSPGMKCWCPSVAHWMLGGSGALRCRGFATDLSPLPELTLYWPICLGGHVEPGS